MGETSNRRVAGAGHGHLVEFYETEAVLAETVSEFVAEGLAEGGSAVIVATGPHRDAFLASLRARRVDTEQTERDSHLIVLDARETLDRFLVGAGPDRARFQQTITSVMDTARPGSGPLRVYGEVVAVLWAEGDVAGAIALEDLWNELASERDFELLCAYPSSAFDNPADAAALARIRQAHTHVIDNAESRTVAGWQRQNRIRRSLIERADPGSKPAPTDRRARAGDEAPLVARLEAALHQGDAGGASAVLESGLRAGVTGAALLSRVVATAMHAIGDAWERGEITVADEHLATATCQRAITWLYPSLLTHRPRSLARVLVAGVEGEAHALAPRVVADVLEGRGYDVIHYGADVPVDALADAVIRHAPELVALSLTMPSGFAALERSIAAVQAARPETLILLGGQGVASNWTRAGFPVADDAEDAVRMVEALLRERPAMPMVMPEAARTQRPSPDPVPDPLAQFESVAAELGVLARENALRAQEYRFLAHEDALTGLPNRRAFEQRLEEIAGFAAGATVMLVDIDEFKRINDSHGHDAGDAMLIDVGRAIVEELRAEDVVARLGGDEFGVVFAHAPDLDANAVAARILAGVERRCAPLGATVSIGVASCDSDPFDAVRKADRALYAAKRQGRNAVRYADSGPASAP